MDSMIITIVHEIEVFYNTLPHGTPYIVEMKLQNALPPDSADIQRYLEQQAAVKWYRQQEGSCQPSMSK